MTIANPQALLTRLLKERGENSWLEFKQNNCDLDEIGRWMSASANGAILAGKDRAYLVFGVKDKTRELVGTSFKLADLKKGGENFINWISRLVEPRPLIEFIDGDLKGIPFSIICIEPTYDRPLSFSGTEYIRIGENIKKLHDFPDHERALWIATGRRKFESAIALTHQSVNDVFNKLDIRKYFTLSRETQSQSNIEVMRKLVSVGFITDNMEGTYDITNLGAILFASDIRMFPSISSKSVRVIEYLGADKKESTSEVEGQKGYAVGFSGLLNFILKRLAKKETYEGGIRKKESIFSEVAIREVLANALIHQDFTLSGSGPVVEIYSNRIEITNPGNSLLQVDRLIDERRSRNEKLASTMRSLGLCEERGGGLDKAVLDIEQKGLPAPAFEPSENSMRVVLFGPIKFSKLSRADKRWACFCHCVVRWVMRDNMTNKSLRQRFSLPDDEYQAVSEIIADAVATKRIIPADPKQGRRYAAYVPYWARSRT